MSYTKRDSGFGESLSLGGFNAYLGLSHEKKTKGNQVFIENFSNKKLEEIFPKKNRKITHDIQDDQNIEKICDYTPFTTYLGFETHSVNKTPIIIKSESINTDDSNIPLPSAAEISINRSLQLIREASARFKSLRHSRLGQPETKVIADSVERIRNLLRN